MAVALLDRERGTVGESAPAGLGVDLRHDRQALGDDALAVATNVDVHHTLGVVRLRLGRSLQVATVFAAAVRRLGKAGSVRYRAAGATLYRDSTAIATDLSPNLVTTFQPMRPLTDPTLWQFIADDGHMRKDDGTNLRLWGIAAPTATPGAGTGAAGSLTGNYSVKYTYVRKVGAAVAHESNPSPASNTVALTSDVLGVNNLVASTDPQVTHIRLYRTQAGGGVYLFDQELANGTTTATSSQADTALGAAVETDNDRPPAAAWVTEFQEHIFLCRDAANPHYLWWSKRFRPESVPPENFVEIGHPGDPLQCAVPLAGLLGVFSRETKHRVSGNATSGFLPQEAISRRGTPAPHAVVVTERGVVFVARDGIFLTNFVAPDEELSAAIAPLFHGETVNGYLPINWDAITTACVAAYKGQLYVALPTGTATAPNVIWVYSAATRAWHAIDHPARSLFVEEGTDTLTAGLDDAQVWVLEDPEATGDGGAAILFTVERDGQVSAPLVRKLFHAAKVDLDCQGQSVTVRLSVDGTLKRTHTVTGTRAKRRLPFPEASMGYSWRVAVTFSGTARVALYGLGVDAQPLKAG